MKIKTNPPGCMNFPDAAEVLVKSKVKVLKGPETRGNPDPASQQWKRNTFFTGLAVNHLHA